MYNRQKEQTKIFFKALAVTLGALVLFTLGFFLARFIFS